MSQGSSLFSTLQTDRGLLRHLPLIALCAMLAASSSQPLLAATATTTALTVSPTALAPGKPAKLVATVTNADHSVVSGTVSFYDGTRLLGTAQVVTHASPGFPVGAATLNIASFDPGVNNITAAYSGTVSSLSSKSSSQPLTITGKYDTATTLAVAGAPGNYALTGTVETFGAAPPAGNIEFLNDTTGSSLGLLSLSSAKQSGSFAIGGTQVSYPGISGVTAVGDFNGDGFADTITFGTVPFGATPDVAVYPGRGDGTFGAPINSPLGYTYPTQLYFGDFNNDGILDIMALDVNATLSLGNGDGTFQAPVPAGFGNPTADCVFGGAGVVTDLDHDGNLDFVVFSNGPFPPHGAEPQAEVCVVRGNGDGTFKPAQFLTLSLPPGYFAAGDLNGDGYPDLVISTPNVQEVLLGKGDGTFQAPINLSLVKGLNAVTFSDLNGDGVLDLLLSPSSQSRVYVALGNGDGTFKPASNYIYTGEPVPPLVLDVNHDGIPDLLYVIQMPAAATVGVLIGNGDGTFQPLASSMNVGLDTEIFFFVPGDFNGDGLPDLFATYSSPYSSSTYGTVLLGDNTYSATLSAVNLPGSGRSSAYAYYTGDTNYTQSASCDESPGVKPQSPKLNGIYSDHIASTTASIGWTSDFPTNGYVSYGTTESLGQSSSFEHNATSFHFVNLTGLAPGTTYYYTVTSIAYFAGCAHWTTTSKVFSFTTATQ